MRRLSTFMLTVVAVIHLLPLAGVLGVDRLEMLYGVALDDPSLQVLMRHRAVLFGLLGAFLLLAVFRPVLQPLAYAAGYISAVSFLVLAGLAGEVNDQVSRVVTADLVALGCLVVGTVALGVGRRKQG